MLFRSKEQAAEWREQAHMPAGELVPFEQVLELSKVWYRDRMSPDFRGRSTAEAQQIFERVGLRGTFWRTEG